MEKQIFVIEHNSDQNVNFTFVIPNNCRIKMGSSKPCKFYRDINCGKLKLRLPLLVAFCLSGENIDLQVSLITEVQFREYFPYFILMLTFIL